MNLLEEKVVKFDVGRNSLSANINTKDSHKIQKILNNPELTNQLLESKDQIQKSQDRFNYFTNKFQSNDFEVFSYNDDQINLKSNLTNTLYKIDLENNTRNQVPQLITQNPEPTTPYLSNLLKATSSFKDGILGSLSEFKSKVLKPAYLGIGIGILALTASVIPFFGYKSTQTKPVSLIPTDTHTIPVETKKYKSPETSKLPIEVPSEPILCSKVLQPKPSKKQDDSDGDNDDDDKEPESKYQLQTADPIKVELARPYTTNNQTAKQQEEQETKSNPIILQSKQSANPVSRREGPKDKQKYTPKHGRQKLKTDYLAFKQCLRWTIREIKYQLDNPYAKPHGFPNDVQTNSSKPLEEAIREYEIVAQDMAHHGLDNPDYISLLDRARTLFKELETQSNPENYNDNQFKKYVQRCMPMAVAMYKGIRDGIIVPDKDHKSYQQLLRIENESEKRGIKNRKFEILFKYIKKKTSNKTLDNLYRKSF